MVGEKAGLSGAAFFDLCTDPREESGKMLPTFPCEGNVQCQDGSLTLYAGAKSPGVDRESNGLPARVARSRSTFAPTVRGAPSSMVSGDR